MRPHARVEDQRQKKKARSVSETEHQHKARLADSEERIAARCAEETTTKAMQHLQLIVFEMHYNVCKKLHTALQTGSQTAIKE